MNKIVLIGLVLIAPFTYAANKQKDAVMTTVEAPGQAAQKIEWTTTESGLKYHIDKAGEETHPTKRDTVKVHYEGKLLDGTKFDSSYDRGEPIAFPLMNVIAGWTEGMQLIGKGGKIQLRIPANLAYGERGAGTIPPGATLDFTVELLDINPEA